MTLSFTRRALLGLAAAAMLSLPATLPADARTSTFSESKFNRQLKSGKPFMVGVHTSWCSTCAAQKRVISSLRAQGAPYKSLTILEMDWDRYRGSKIGRSLRIPRRSTLIMYKGGKEVGRIIAGTSSSQIKRLIDRGYQ